MNLGYGISVPCLRKPFCRKVVSKYIHYGKRNSAITLSSYPVPDGTKYYSAYLPAIWMGIRPSYRRVSCRKPCCRRLHPLFNCRAGRGICKSALSWTARPSFACDCDGNGTARDTVGNGKKWGQLSAYLRRTQHRCSRARHSVPAGQRRSFLHANAVTHILPINTSG